MDTSTNVEEAIAKLRAEESHLAQQSSALKDQQKTVSQSLKRLRVSITALSGEGSGKPTLSDEAATRFLAESLQSGGPRSKQSFKQDSLSTRSRVVALAQVFTWCCPEFCTQTPSSRMRGREPQAHMIQSLHGSMKRWVSTLPTFL